MYFILDFSYALRYPVFKEVRNMLVYKIDVLESLKEAGYTTTRLRREKLLGENAIQYIREGKPVGAKALDNICRLLDMQPGNIIKYVEK
jgi:putative transcriptional regulator